MRLLGCPVSGENNLVPDARQVLLTKMTRLNPSKFVHSFIGHGAIYGIMWKHINYHIITCMIKDIRVLDVHPVLHQEIWQQVQELDVGQIKRNQSVDCIIEININKYIGG